jgi:predicted 3-demethylubiquinone-9 3-methyltransferase (glyoxalase superfamily)
MARSVTPFVMFQHGESADAIRFYAGVFDGAEAKDGALAIGGRDIRFFDSPVEHDFGFTPAVSLFVDFDDAGDLDRAFERLSEGGQVLMPLDAYEFSSRFAWVNDRFGVSWQLNLV